HTPLPTTLSLYAYAHNRDLHSFPTRRSSDLIVLQQAPQSFSTPHCSQVPSCLQPRRKQGPIVFALMVALLVVRVAQPSRQRQSRSEEHTSELQSRSDLVCRLLLEKKK